MKLGFQGDPNGGGFNTVLGAFLKSTALLPSPLPDTTITNRNYSLNTTSTYTPSPPDTSSDSDSFTPAKTEFGVDVFLASASVGIDYDIVQNSTHTVSGVNGIARAVHQGSGQIRDAWFSLDATDNVSLDLDLGGIWDVNLASLSLSNLFSTDFDLALVAFAEASIIGFGGREEITLASIDLFSNTPFALDLRSTNTLSNFQINVVPEPSTLSLMTLGLLCMATAIRRRKARGNTQ